MLSASIWPLLLASKWIVTHTLTPLKVLQGSDLQFPHWATSMQISSFIPHFLELHICYKTLCEILSFTIISCCPQLGSVTLITTGVSGTTGFLGAMGSCLFSAFHMHLPRFPLQVATPPSLCTVLCQRVFLYLDISDAYDSVSVLCACLLGLWWMADMLIANLLSNCYLNSFSDASLHHLHSHTN